MTLFLLNPDGSMSQVEETVLIPCPGCGGKRTTLVEEHVLGCKFDTTKPMAKSLFDIPPLRHDRWVVEWRWTPRVWKAIVGASVEKLTHNSNVPSMYNDWQEHQMDGRLHGYTTERQAVNARKVLKRSFPGKQFRVRSRAS